MPVVSVLLATDASCRQRSPEGISLRWAGPGCRLGRCLEGKGGSALIEPSCQIYDRWRQT